MRKVSREAARRLVGKAIYAVRKDGTRVTGRLVKVSGQRLILRPLEKGKKVNTKAILPLVLFDLLAIGTLPFAGGFGGGFGPGFGPGYGPGPYGGGGFGPYGGGYGGKCCNSGPFFY